MLAQRAIDEHFRSVFIAHREAGVDPVEMAGTGLALVVLSAVVDAISTAVRRSPR